MHSFWKCYLPRQNNNHLCPCFAVHFLGGSTTTDRQLTLTLVLAAKWFAVSLRRPVELVHF